MNALACCCLAGISGAGVVVVAVLHRVAADTGSRIAGIGGAEQAVTAVLGCEHAAGSCIARVGGAEAVVVAHKRCMSARSGSRITGIGGAGFVVIAAGGGVTARVHCSFLQIEVGAEIHEWAIHHRAAVDVVIIIVI